MPAPLDRPASTLSSSATIPVSPSLEPKLEATISNHPLEDDTQAQKPAAGNPFAGKGSRFWLVFLALCVSTFLSALDLTAVSTTLISMAADLDSTEYSWVGSAYALTSTALIPWTGGLAAIFGRRSTMLGSLVIFAAGSAITGAAPSMNIVILGRSIQGIGGGGILTMTEIVIVDLLPLAERGAFFGVVGAVWAIASAIGPPIGGALASAGQWRWLFYLNLPLTAIAIVLVLFFLRIKEPQTTMKEKLAQMDYVNVLFVAGSTATILGLTWGGVSYSWSSYKVLVPLILGIFGMALFLWIEKRFVKHPTVPFDILSNRTSLAGFLMNFIHGIVSLAAIYYLPVYFQATKGTSAIQSGVNLFTLSFTIAPFAIFTGISIGVSGHYKLQNFIGWSLTIIGFGLTSMLRWDSSKGAWVGYPILMGMGLGVLYASTNFPVLAPLKPSQQPHAMAFFGFTRAFGQVFGIAIGSTVLQNQLTKNLPSEFTSQLGGSSEIAFSAIPLISGLAEPLRTEVRAAFANSIQTIWQVMIGLAGLGFLVAFAMRSLPLTSEVDENWGLAEKKPASASTAEVQV
ncbi:iron permease [Leucosporidium creatinivorum]|uniref:Iron permease n=1 Tax=Leucosporidium creatinivorum TaxID=106004 RepID=A0A1Y2DX19_9BASI|nr:iron permease [Leucosporidium creatinivorum]